MSRNAFIGPIMLMYIMKYQWIWVCVHIALHLLILSFYFPVDFIDAHIHTHTQLYNVNRSNYRTNGMEAKIENLCRMDDFRVHKSRKMSLNSLTHSHRGDGVAVGEMKGMKRSYFLSLSQSLDSRQHESENLLIISYHKQYWMIYRFLHKHKEWTWYNLIMWNTTSTRCSPKCYKRRTMRKKV